MSLAVRWHNDWMALDPTQIGRYRVLGTLGQGAMGTVFLAEDPALKRGVAIKVVRQGLGDAGLLTRFRREAEISARLNHPNIITIFDVGEDPDLGPFLAMEFVDGEGLDARVKAGSVAPEEVLSILIQAAQALEAIHRESIVHRDVKPSNFMLAKDGRLKLMDFGVARGGEMGLTTTGGFLGTPAYAAPESFSGTGRLVESWDRWSLAVTAFELLTGRLPFAAESVNALLYRVVHEPPRLPDSMSPELKVVFERAFAKDPAARYESLRAFLEALATALPLDESTRSAVAIQIASPSLNSGVFRAPARPKVRLPKRVWIIASLVGALGIGAWMIHAVTGKARPVAIYSNPPGAEVFLDGVDLGRTPLDRVVVKGGGTLRLEKPDYLPLERTLDAKEARVDMRLTPAPYSVRFVSEPSAAGIWVDGAKVGGTPKTIQLPGGRHQVEIRMEGYEPWSATLGRHDLLPTPIRLQKKEDSSSPNPKGKVKKVKDFLKNLLDE